MASEAAGTVFAKRPFHLSVLILSLLSVVALYFVTILAVATSRYIQTVIVFAHIIRWPIGDLTNLKRFGLQDVAENLEIITANNESIRGWHIFDTNTSSSEMTRCLSQSPRINTYNNTPTPALTEHARALCFKQLLANSSRIIIYFHGNSASRGLDFRITKVRALSRRFNAHVLTFDYRGFADSQWESVTPTEESVLQDGINIVQYVVDIVKMYNSGSNVNKDNTTLCTDRNNVDSSATVEMITVEHIPSADVPCDEPHCGTNSSTQLRKQQHLPQRHSMTMMTTMTIPRIYIYGHSLGSAVGTAVAVHFNESCWFGQQSEEAQAETAATVVDGGADCMGDQPGCAITTTAAAVAVQVSLADTSELANAQITTTPANAPAKPHESAEGKEEGTTTQLTQMYHVYIKPQRVISGLILDSAFTSITDLLSYYDPFSKYLPGLRDRMLRSFHFHFPTKSRLQYIKHIPLLIMHGTGDYVIPYQHGHDLYETAMFNRNKTDGGGMGKNHTAISSGGDSLQCEVVQQQEETKLLLLCEDNSTHSTFNETSSISSGCADNAAADRCVVNTNASVFVKYVEMSGVAHNDVFKHVLWGESVRELIDRCM